MTSSDLMSSARPAREPQLREVDFEPPVGLRSAHVQTIAASSFARRLLVERRARAFRAAAESRILTCPDGTRLEALLTQHGDDAERPLVVGLHGWHGCADSLYMLSVGSALHAAGYDVARLHLRDHGGTHGLNTGLFHSCRLQEVVDAIAVLQQQFPRKPLLLLGFSLGGNFALRVARAAPAAGLDLRRTLAVCPVLDPAATMTALDGGWFVYRFYFMQKWRRSMLHKAAHFPERYDFSATRAIRALGPMTDWFVEHHTEFRDSDEYLNGYAITGDYLHDLQVSSRILSALDDPVIPGEGLRRLAPSEALDISVARYGGHCGFIRDHRLASWLDAEILADFRQYS